MENLAKRKLKRLGSEIYLKYFLNPDDIINEIVKTYRKTGLIDESICNYIFDVPLNYKNKIYEILLYYPNKVKNNKSRNY